MAAEKASGKDLKRYQLRVLKKEEGGGSGQGPKIPTEDGATRDRKRSTQRQAYGAGLGAAGRAGESFERASI